MSNSGIRRVFAVCALRCRAVVASRARQRGASAIEYALLGALIAVVIVGGVSATGVNLGSLYESVKDKVVAAISG